VAKTIQLTGTNAQSLDHINQRLCADAACYRYGISKRFIRIRYVLIFSVSATELKLPGDLTYGETPDPFPNSEAKPVRPMIVFRGESR
jgi:hypothetical protein